MTLWPVRVAASFSSKKRSRKVRPVTKRVRGNARDPRLLEEGHELAVRYSLDGPQALCRVLRNGLGERNLTFVDWRRQPDASGNATFPGNTQESSFTHSGETCWQVTSDVSAPVRGWQEVSVSRPSCRPCVARSAIRLPSLRRGM